MYLSNLKLWNFRKFGSDSEIYTSEGKLRKPDLSVKFTKRLNVLIGENDSGKTAIIDAIKLVLKTHSFDWIKIEQSDFYQECSKLRIECIIKFEDIELDKTISEAKNFTEWITYEKVEEKSFPTLRVFIEASRNSERIFPYEVKAGSEDEGYILDAGAKELLQTTYLKPLRDAPNELTSKKNSRLSQILIGHKLFKVKNKEEEHMHELVKNFDDLRDKLKAYFSNTSNGQDEIKRIINKFLENFFGKSMNFDFDTSEKTLKSILELLKIYTAETNLGLGSQNLLCMATELLHLTRDNWLGLKLALIEELEAHLHPQAQLRVIEHLEQQTEAQFILTTHSPNLSSKVKLGNIFICVNDMRNKPNIFPLGFSDDNDEESYTNLSTEDYKFLERFLDVTKSNLFFAKGVILVEGWAEEIILPTLANKIGINLTQKGISVVNIAGEAFLRYSKIFQRKKKPYMNVPISIITDVDVLPEDEENNLKNEINAKRQKHQCLEQNIKAFISPKWTLEYCLSKSSSIGSKFKDILKEIHPRTDFDTNYENALSKKLKDNTLNKLEIAYKLAQSLDENNGITIDENDIHIKYLIDAIKHAASSN